MSEEKPHDYYVRQVALDNAVALVKDGASPDKVLRIAEKFYGFLTRTEAAVTVLKPLNQKQGDIQ